MPQPDARPLETVTLSQLRLNLNSGASMRFVPSRPCFFLFTYDLCACECFRMLWPPRSDTSPATAQASSTMDAGPGTGGGPEGDSVRKTPESDVNVQPSGRVWVIKAVFSRSAGGRVSGFQGANLPELNCTWGRLSVHRRNAERPRGD
jgi:hypothetical protein